MDIVRAEVHEEGRFAVFVDVANGMRSNGVGNIFIAPQGSSAAFHIANAPNASHDSLVVPVAGPLFGEELWMCTPRRFAGEVALIIHVDRSRGIVVGHAPILNIDAGHAVGSGGHNIMVVETKVGGRLVQLPVPILLGCATAQAEVPLAKGCRVVASGMKGIGHGIALGRDNHPRIAGGHICSPSPQGVFAREQSVARGGARGGAGMGIGEAGAAARQAVNGRRLHTGGSIARQVAIAEVVGQNDDDVGSPIARSSGLPVARKGR